MSQCQRVALLPQHVPLPGLQLLHLLVERDDGAERQGGQVTLEGPRDTLVLPGDFLDRQELGRGLGRLGQALELTQLFPHLVDVDHGVGEGPCVHGQDTLPVVGLAERLEEVDVFKPN